VEHAIHRMRHMALLRSLQVQTGGFTEFVPLSFVHAEAPLFLETTDGVSAGPSGDDVVRLYAIARLMLGPTFRNIQASWVKEGLRTAQWLLHAGANDLGGTLMNESISTSAGAQHGQLTTPANLRATIRNAGRKPLERSTLYAALREFPADAAQASQEAGPLDHLRNPEATFGSYDALVQDPRFHYEWRPPRRRLPVTPESP